MSNPHDSASAQAAHVAREALLARVLPGLEADPRLEAAVLVGSLGAGGGDRWSDIDLALVVAAGVDCPAVTDEWVRRLSAELGIVHRYEVAFDTCLVRGLFLPTGLLLDLSFTPLGDFGMWGPGRVLFDRGGRVTRTVEAPVAWHPTPDWSGAAGLAWHDVLHGAAAIDRGHPWQALFYVERIRTHTLRLASERHGHDADELAKIDLVPPEEVAALLSTLVHDLEPGRLAGALLAAASAFVAELRRGDPDLAGRIEEPLLAPALAAFRSVERGAGG